VGLFTFTKGNYLRSGSRNLPVHVHGFFLVHVDGVVSFTFTMFFPFTIFCVVGLLE